MEKKETNQKGIDFLILINTFPLLQGPSAGHDGHIYGLFCPSSDKRQFFIIFLCSFSFQRRKVMWANRRQTTQESFI